MVLFVPSSNYTVTDMSDDHTVTINGYGQISIGDVVTFIMVDILDLNKN